MEKTCQTCIFHAPTKEGRNSSFCSQFYFPTKNWWKCCLHATEGYVKPIVKHFRKRDKDANTPRH